MLLVYSLGLGIPFIISALLVDSLKISHLILSKEIIKSLITYQEYF